MWIKEEVTDIQLGEKLWSGAVDTWNTICEAGKEGQAMQYLENVFCNEEAIDLTSLNDYLWFESGDILDALGLNEDENKEYDITREELQQLKDNGILSEAHIQAIEDNFIDGFTLSNITSEDLNDIEELTDEEVKELDRVVV